MKKSRIMFFLICPAVMIVVSSITGAQSQIQVKPKPSQKMEPVTPPRPSVSPKSEPEIQLDRPQLCIDLKVELSYISNPADKRGIVELKGNIRNIGIADYVSPPKALVAVYYVDTRHPPATYGQEGVGSKELSRRSIPTIGRGGLYGFNHAYTIPNFVQWGHRNPEADERQAVCQFTLRIENPSGGPISKRDDCVASNNQFTTVELPYMDRSPISRKLIPDHPAPTFKATKPGEAKSINPQPEPP